MTDTTENVDSPNDDQEDVVDILDISDDEQDPEALRTAAKEATAKAKELADKNRQLFARTKKAEGFVLKDGQWVKPEPKPTPPSQTPAAPEEKDSITSRDTIALMRADVHEDDIAAVVRYAKFEGISVTEALKSDVVKTILKTKVEQRKTAQATSTGPTRSGNAQRSGEGILEKASSTGELPESDEDMAKLAKARFSPKK